VIDFVSVMSKPFLACLVLTGIHAYLGFHVIKREIIFVDLSLAQIAALGAVIAILVGYEPHSQAAYWLSLGATVIGAILLSLTRSRGHELPQEAMIGIIYVVSAALSVLLLHRAPEGDEHIRHIFVGNVLLVEMSDIVKMIAIYSLVGLFHFIFRKKFFAITMANTTEIQSLNIKKWDLLFYLSFGIVVTSSVEIAGILLVFSFLIIPAAMAVLLATTTKARLMLGWLCGTLLSLVGIALSYILDLPTGATIVCVFGLGFLATRLFKLKKCRA
jgi:zinc/manganese transport system permease protein